MKKIKEYIKQLFCNHRFTEKYVYEGDYDDYIVFTCKKCDKSYIKDK